MPGRCMFEYAIVRVVPHVEREEFVNVGVILFCRTLRFLDTRIRLNAARLAAFAPGFDLAMVQAQLDLIPRICAGGDEAGTLGQMSQAERFRWLVSPRNTVIQLSPVHCGLCADPRAMLEDVFARMVAD
jgi:hypothetical protein